MVEIERTVNNLGVGGELGIDSGSSKKIEGDEGLTEKVVPQMKWKIRVGAAAESGDEMVFECSDGTFGGISAMEVRRRD